MRAPIPYYIQGIGAVSPQPTFDAATFLDAPIHYEQNTLQCVVPDFKKYINPIQIRRMSRIMRIGMSASKICMDDAALTMPDGIITATGYGCADDTIKFLEEILVNKEKQLTPSLFTQSTYNSLAGAIALSLKCKNYNTTYVHKAFSFETALLDAMMQIADSPAKRFLIGGFDETDTHHHTITTRIGYFKTEPTPNFDIYRSGTVGTIEGEGASFVVLGTEQTTNAYAKVEGLKTYYNPENYEHFKEIILDFLKENEVSINDVDLMLSGRSGCSVHDQWLAKLTDDMFADTCIAHYKHLVGDYSVSSAFATWLSARILRSGLVPESLLPTKRAVKLVRRVLYINQYMGSEYSMMLFSAI